MKSKLKRQISQYLAMSKQLRHLDWETRGDAWLMLEAYTAIDLRKHLQNAIEEVIQSLSHLVKQTEGEFDQVALNLDFLSIRMKYKSLQACLDFFAKAINSNRTEKEKQILSGWNHLAESSMINIFKTLDQPTPKVLVYLRESKTDINQKVNVQFWHLDEKNTIAAIQVNKEHLQHPTTILRAVGKELAGLLDWSTELEEAIKNEIDWPNGDAGLIWGGWATEIVADAYTFSHMGYTALANLYDELSKNPHQIFNYEEGNLQPTPYLRLILNMAWCQLSFDQEGPWDEMMFKWTYTNDWLNANNDVYNLIKDSFDLVPKVALLAMTRPMRALGGYTLKELEQWLQWQGAFVMKDAFQEISMIK